MAVPRHWRTSDPPDALPPPPPGVRYVRVVGLGTVIADDPLRGRVHRFFHWPMIILALAVLPLLAVELLYLHNRPERIFTPIWWACAWASAVIWLAFTVEFAIKVTIAECRLEYVRRNWLDIVIILVPFLRPLRVAYLARTSRVFTLRGVGMKFARSVFTVLLGLEAADRLLRRMGVKVEGRKDPLRMTRHELITELRSLRRAVDAWEGWYAANEAHRDGSDGPRAGSYNGRDAGRPRPAQPDRR